MVVAGSGTRYAFCIVLALCTIASQLSLQAAAGYQDAFVQHSAHRRLTQNANINTAGNEAARASSAAVAPAISSVCGGGNVQAVANTAARASATATAAAVVKAGATTAGPSAS
ncbi:hypothetical protein V8C86DRAFT_3131337, partial [Haematococcus lacustris]